MRTKRTNDQNPLGFMRLSVARIRAGHEREVILDVGPEEFAHILAESESVAILEYGRYGSSGWANGTVEQRKIAELVGANSDKMTDRDALEFVTKRRKKATSSAGVSSEPTGSQDTRRY
jgi:hypothetical protein